MFVVTGPQNPPKWGILNLRRGREEYGFGGKTQLVVVNGLFKSHPDLAQFRKPCFWPTAPRPSTRTHPNADFLNLLRGRELCGAGLVPQKYDLRPLRSNLRLLGRELV